MARSKNLVSFIKISSMDTVYTVAEPKFERNFT